MAAPNQQGKTWRDGSPELTPRELEIVTLMVEGLSDRQIAEQLGVGYEAARSYGKNLRRKLGAATRAQAVAKLLTLGMTGLRR
ncbi:MAG: response regulator transcription factor [Cyanobacteriota bacterium]